MKVSLRLLKLARHDPDPSAVVSVLVLVDQVKHEAAMFNALIFSAIMFNPITPALAPGEA
jgi:hypothetical protein